MRGGPDGKKGVVPVLRSRTSQNGTGRVESFDSRTCEIAKSQKGDSIYEYLTVGFSWTETQGPESPEISKTEVLNTREVQSRAELRKFVKLKTFS